MASSESPLTIQISRTANGDLWEIWRNNLEQYRSVEHADRYLEFLKLGIQSLLTEPDASRPLRGVPEYRFITLKRSRSGHGHYVVFKVDFALRMVKVLRVLHTRMDIQARLQFVESRD